MKAVVSYLLTTLAAVGLIKVLKTYQRDLALFSTLTTVVLLSGIVLSIVLPIVDYINYLAKQYSIDYLSVLWKAVGISFICATAADLCRSAEEEAIASKVELIGKCELLVLALPLFQELTDLILQVLSQTV